jgi:hypothetical protein
MHIITTSTQTSITIYKNGENLNSKYENIDSGFSNKNIKILNSNCNIGKNLVGYLDEFRIYDFSVSEIDIPNIFNSDC